MHRAEVDNDAKEDGDRAVHCRQALGGRSAGELHTCGVEKAEKSPGNNSICGLVKKLHRHSQLKVSQNSLERFLPSFSEVSATLVSLGCQISHKKWPAVQCSPEVHERYSLCLCAVFFLKGIRSFLLLGIAMACCVMSLGV